MNGVGARRLTRDAVQIGGTVLAALAAALLADAAGLPLPYLLAPLLTVGAMSLAGAPTTAVPFGRRLGQAVIGTAIGLYLNPGVVEEMLALLPVMMAVAGLSIAISIAIAALAAARAGFGLATAYFACMPGGVAEMAGLGRQYGADEATVAILQSLRIAVVVTVMAPAVALLAEHGPGSAAAGLPDVHWPELVVLLSAAGLLSALLERFSVPNAWMLGGLACGAATAALALPLSGMPGVLVSAGQLLVGCALGTRFKPDLMRGGARLAATGLLIMGGLLLGGIALGLAAAALTGMAPAVLLLATAPGGITEMSITAKVVGLPVATVVAFHLVRIVTVVLASAPLYRLLMRIRPVGERRLRRGGPDAPH